MRATIKRLAGSTIVLVLFCCRSAPTVYYPSAPAIPEPPRVFVHYSRPEANGFRLAEIGIDGLGCGSAAIAAATRAAAERGANAVVVRCLDPHGHELAWSRSETERGTSLTVILMKVPSPWYQPGR